jgi:hypothetical protein
LGKLVSSPLFIITEEKLMTATATHYANGNTSEVTLFVAFEHSEKTWKLGFATSHDQKPRRRSMPAWDYECGK